MKTLFGVLLLAVTLGVQSCASESATKTSTSANEGVPNVRTMISSYEVVNSFPHDPTAFTQGLIFQDGALLESTGLERHSTLRRVELQTGKVLQKIDVPPFYFAEGMTLFGERFTN